MRLETLPSVKNRRWTGRAIRPSFSGMRLLGSATGTLGMRAIVPDEDEKDLLVDWSENTSGTYRSVKSVRSCQVPADLGGM